MAPYEILENTFRAAVASVLPGPLIRKSVTVCGDTLHINGTTVKLNRKGRLLVAGAGKASGLMASELEKLLGERIDHGTVVVKQGHAAPCQQIRIREAGHPYPDEAGVAATREITALCREAGEDDLILFLVSGGGSALLADYPAGSSLEELAALSKLLVTSGANIREINAVRKHLSSVKGGQLARLAYPAQLVSLIISDVVGDPLDVIASGPTVADTSTYAEALAVCRRYKITDRAPASLMRVLEDGAAGRRIETPKPGDPSLAQALNRVLGNNRVALDAGLAYLRRLGVPGEVVTDRLEGNTEEAAARIVQHALAKQNEISRKHPYALVFGGETTVCVTGNGLGGRNQHLALQAAWLLREQVGITLLAAGTDGTDGPTEMAGAIVDGNTAARGRAAGMEIMESLRNFDAYTFFRAAGGHVCTGPTLTNVMDMIVVLIA